MILGHHVYTKYGFETCASYAHSNGAKIFQIFLGSPQSFSPFSVNPKSIIKLKEECVKYDILNVIHGSFLINLCKSLTDNICQKAIRRLSEDLNNSVILNSLGVVIHMGHNTCDISDDMALNNYISNLKYVLRHSNKKSTIILETGAGQGHEVGTSLYELGFIRKSLNQSERRRVKFCLDTCHMFAHGYDLSEPEYIDLLESYIDLKLGWKNVVLVHLNDSKTPIGKKVDRHADIGKGYISKEGIIHFVKLCIRKDIPMVLETPTEEYNEKRLTSKKQIELIGKWLR